MNKLLAVSLFCSVALLAAPARAAEKVHAGSATLTVAQDGRSALRAALAVLGKPSEQWKITEKDNAAGGAVDVVAFAQKNRKTIALYFYGGKFIQLVAHDPAQRPPAIRGDYKQVAAAAAGAQLGAYALSGTRGAVDVRATGGAPAP